jgi:putative inorganic carbon (hco3(-)) transporter
MNFALFLLLNAILLIRPEELFPDLAGLRLYLIVIVLCTITSLPRLIELLSPSSLRTRPVAVCVLLFLASTIISLCVRGRIEEALFDFGSEFAKVILYYFLLLAVVNTPTRFRVFIATLVVLIVSLTAIALAQHNGAVEFANIKPVAQREIDPETGEDYILNRLVSTGIFNDPNDLCLILGMGILSCIYFATVGARSLLLRALWLLPIPLFVYALTETHSRGGLLGVLIGVAAYLYSRYGGTRGLPLAVAVVVAALVLIGGRQANIGGGGTAHERLMFWASGLSELFANPLYIPTGLGRGWFVDDSGQVAHNSFVQAYVEQGLLGGGAFLAAFYLGVRILHRFGRGVDAPRWALEARHFGFAVIVGYGMGCYSLSRSFVIPTYIALGIASVLLDQAAPRLPVKFRVSGRWFIWLALFSVCGLVLIKFMTQGLGAAGL